MKACTSEGVSRHVYKSMNQNVYGHAYASMYRFVHRLCMDMYVGMCIDRST